MLEPANGLEPEAIAAGLVTLDVKEDRILFGKY
jgi:hypothetical protein